MSVRRIRQWEVYFSGNIFPNSQCENGAAANMFQKNAMGKFFRRVPAQIAGSRVTGAPARMTLNKMEATRLIVGHMMATVPAWRSIRHM